MSAYRFRAGRLRPRVRFGMRLGRLMRVLLVVLLDAGHVSYLHLSADREDDATDDGAGGPYSSMQPGSLYAVISRSTLNRFTAVCGQVRWNCSARPIAQRVRRLRAYSAGTMQPQKARRRCTAPYPVEAWRGFVEQSGLLTQVGDRVFATDKGRLFIQYLVGRLYGLHGLYRQL